MANIKLSDLIKQINEEHKPPGGWRASDKIKKNKGPKRSSEQASEREGGPTSTQADKLNAVNSSRFVEGAQAQLGRKPKSAR
jgi:hypothetical protein